MMQLKQIRARRRFKAIVRLAFANRAWLTPAIASDQSNIKKNVHLMAKKKPLKSILDLYHKAILNKPAQDRTEEEKLLLYRTIGGFKCFRKYPEHVKMMLAANAYFAYYGPDRVIVRQNHRAQALYFVISGEVSVSVEKYDKLLNENVTIITGNMTSGSTFGEDSMLTDVPRKFTITSITPVEFLLLTRDDYNIVLKDSVRKEWDYILSALKRFTYFDSWDDVTKTACCIVAKVKQFKKDQTIIGDGEGLRHGVHFVLKGSCQLIEHLLIEQVDCQGTKKYKLFQDYPSSARSSLTIISKKNSATRSSFTIHTADKSHQSHSQRSHSSSGIRSDRESLDSHEFEADNRSVSYGPQFSDVYTYFMQVCLFSENACFGLGENMDRRRIIAFTDTECLIIPRYWLLQLGSNIWLRIQQYLQANIPTTNELFKQFLKQRKWRAYRKEFAENKVRRVPCNVPQNVPYSIRINEDYDYLDT